jgi:hypothetical protein
MGRKIDSRKGIGRVVAFNNSIAVFGYQSYSKMKDLPKELLNNLLKPMIKRVLIQVRA